MREVRRAIRKDIQTGQADRQEGKVNKADMIEQIAQAAEISKSAAERAVDAMIRSG